jgi:hypothetical protein
MGKYIVNLRYYTGDPLDEIYQEDLDKIGATYGVKIIFNRIDNRTLSEGMLREETLGKAIEEITQDVITVDADDEETSRKAVIAIYEKYRSPRTPYSFWGSSPDGERIAKALVEETGGGWY